MAKSTFESQNVQNTACLDHFCLFRCRKIARHCGEKHIRKCTFGSSDAEKLYAAVAQSTFGSKNVKKLRVRDHFLKFGCSKIVRRCGEKHICKSKCTKHEVFGPLWYVLMLKNCLALWRNAHLQVKMCKTPHVWTTFVCSDVAKLHAAVAKCTFESQNVQNTACLDHFCLFRCRKIACRCGEMHI